jgi:hypothetical protein
MLYGKLAGKGKMLVPVQQIGEARNRKKTGQNSTFR